MGGLFALGIAVAMSGAIYCWPGRARGFEEVEKHRRQMDALAPERRS